MGWLSGRAPVLVADCLALQNYTPDQLCSIRCEDNIHLINWVICTCKRDCNTMLQLTERKQTEAC